MHNLPTGVGCLYDLIERHNICTQSVYLKRNDVGCIC